MELLLKEEEGVYCVEVRGKIDTNDVETLELYLKGMRGKGIKGIMMDMSGVDGIVSAAIGMLIGFGDEIEAGGGRLVFLNPNVKVLVVFKRMGMDSVFKIAETYDEAKKALTGA